MANGIVFPLSTGGHIIGRPHEGTHASGKNWESDNAVDYATPKGSPVYAVAAGTIGSQIGSQHSSNPLLGGLRLHLVTTGNEFYYAHLSKLVVKAGATVQAGQLLGYSGVANGVEHLHFAAKNGDPLKLLSDPSYVSPEGVPPSPADPTTTPTSNNALTPTPTAIVAPQAPPLPTDLPLPGVGLQMPGTVKFVPHQLAALWQSVAQDDLVSPDTQRLIQNAQLTAGG